VFKILGPRRRRKEKKRKKRKRRGEAVPGRSK